MFPDYHNQKVGQECRYKWNIVTKAMKEGLPFNWNFDNEKMVHKAYVAPPKSTEPIIYPVPKKEKPVKTKKIKEPKPAIPDLFSGME